jgi:hypothetical protein
VSEGNAGSVDLAILSNILAELNKLDADQRKRILSTIATFYQIDIYKPAGSTYPLSEQSIRAGTPTTFSEDRTMSVKDFLWQKQPKTAVERVACLAYYLAHYRETPFFKTIEISKLNTEAAQVKFSNAAVAVNDAYKTGYLVAAERGKKQLSALGEQFVRALPDRETARAIVSSARRRRRKKAREDQDS